MRKAYATGIEGRLFAEMVKDAESWISLGIMRTKENLITIIIQLIKMLKEKLSAQNCDKIPVDSTTNAVGWLRRPTIVLSLSECFSRIISAPTKISKCISVFFTEAICLIIFRERQISQCTYHSSVHSRRHWFQRHVAFGEKHAAQSFPI